MKHSPGPWTATDYSGVIEIHSADMYIGEVPIEDDTDRANARLIAAAPLLLEALQAILEHLNDPTPEDTIYRRPHCIAEAAIAAATTEEE